MKPVEFMRLFPEFAAPSWDAWRDVLGRVTPETREFYAVAGRGSGKSRIVALLAACYGCREYDRAPGEQVFIGVFGPDRKQARLTFSYIGGLLESRPELKRLVLHKGRESMELEGGIVIEVVTASTAAPRGRSYALVIVEEAAFLPTDDSANPDVELLRAVRPGLARVPGSLLAVVSSPYARRGILFDAWKRHRETEDGRVVFVQAATLDLNPTFDRSAVAIALAEDPESARAEYLAEFRRDVESFISRDAVEACVVSGRRELAFVVKTQYQAFVDPSGGRGDSFALAIGHAENRGKSSVVVVDAVRERRPPFSPEQVVEEFADLLSEYRLRRVTGDRYAGEWPREAFSRHDVAYESCRHPKSDLYLSFLAFINSSRVELPDDERLVGQIVGLERRTSRSGRDSVDHAPSGHDDLANAVAGLIAELGSGRGRRRAGTWGRRFDYGRGRLVVNTGRSQILRERRALAELMERGSTRISIW